MDSERFKVILTAALIVSGALLTASVGTGHTSSAEQSEGLALDFGDMSVVWTELDLSLFTDPYEALEQVCYLNGFSLGVSETGEVEEIDGCFSDPEGRSWHLWLINSGSTVWNLAEGPVGTDLSEYTLAAWAYCSSSETPSVGTDQSGRSIYGHGKPYRSVTLSPSVTEVVSSVGAVETIVGTDRYSDYPSSVVEGQQSGRISIVGDFTTPNYEAIVKTRPDVVLCDGSQYNHIQMADRLRVVGIDSVLMYSGESIDTIVDNIFIAGTVMGMAEDALQTIRSLEGAMEEIAEVLDGSPFTKYVRTMVSLSPDMSPWVSGSYTYVDDIMSDVYGVNIFSNYDGWVHLNSEQIMDRNPSVIIILTYDYPATQESYDAMIAGLSNEWKATDAYKNGEIYLVSEDAGEMSQRPGPRFAQVAELVARILNPDIFGDITMSKFIGSDYRDYLTYTKELGFQ
ncbi:MAG: ABC transporter substrate-binding protein [Candidatus Methanomethylophilaceae archaeon]|jgi:iron complex transport system substrate-binding protein|nr:ABC transporter substrate-binding protein [Candidatus Methanomethylophilaceae archaeon]